MARIRFGNPMPGRSVEYAADAFGVISGRNHHGWDWRVPTGTPIRASASGGVTECGDLNPDAGLGVELGHGSGWTSRYVHMSRLLVNLGDRVSYGTILGEVGKTGNAKVPHLHAAWYLFGTAIDPALIVEPDAGPNVALIQKRLRAHGFDPGPVDGRFGPLTATALAAFQASAGLDPTGVVDEWTVQRLGRKVGSGGSL